MRSATKTPTKHPNCSSPYSLEECLKYKSKNKCIIKSNSSDDRLLYSKYQKIREELIPLQEKAVLGALYRDAVNGNRESVRYLTDHGPKHIEKVIEKASEIVQLLKPEYILSVREVFYLLCAIQAHDAGVYFGREDHESRIKEILREKCGRSMLNSTDIDEVSKLAYCHTGEHNGDPDKISRLPEANQAQNLLRRKFLAAVLRLSDELSDCWSRSDEDFLQAYGDGSESKLYHVYSLSLQNARILEVTGTTQYKIELEYILPDGLEYIRTPFKVNTSEKFLIDEIYRYTEKIERERLYCSRFIRQLGINIDRTDVCIIVTDKEGLELKKITYEIMEVGYPEIGILTKIIGDQPNGNSLKEDLCSEESQ